MGSEQATRVWTSAILTALRCLPAGSLSAAQLSLPVCIGDKAAGKGAPEGEQLEE